jgi:Recombination endonuclease VII
VKKKRPCTRCKKPNAIPPSKLCATCKREAKKKSQETARNNRAQKVYGLQDGDYKKLWDGSPHGPGTCYICGRKSRKLALDHDHKTGEARGLLCVEDNFHLLGRIGKDDPEILRQRMEAAIEYLKNPPSRRIL